MDISVNDIVFEPDDNFPKPNILLPDVDPERKAIMLQFLQSGYFFNFTLNVSKFLFPDKSIDIEKLELAVFLLVEYLEFSEKFKNPIHVYLANFDDYFKARHIDPSNIHKIIEERRFIRGFCQAVADEYSSSKKFIMDFDRRSTIRR